MADIPVPKPPKKAFNPNRPASDLLKYQIEHLEWAVRHAGQRKGKRIKIKPVKTEADAAARTRALIPKLVSANELPFTYSEAPPESVAPKPRARKARARKAARKRKTRKRRTSTKRTRR